MNNKLKNNKGITLVAIAITIIVLIILAGVSINLLFGDNGLINIAQKARENTELAKIEEKTSLNELDKEIESQLSSIPGSSYEIIEKLTEFKTAIAKAIEEAGGVKTETIAETEIFENNIKGIVKEVTKDATAIADSISEGKTAWVNGELVTGTGKDNNTQYEKGYADGIAKANNGKIVYEYHHHVEKCKATCNSYYTRSIVLTLGNDQYTAYCTLHHPTCGKNDETYYWTVAGNAFNNQSSPHVYYTCGYEEGELIGAKMEF